jgi:hypothetical protein
VANKEGFSALSGLLSNKEDERGLLDIKGDSWHEMSVKVPILKNIKLLVPF